MIMKTFHLAALVLNSRKTVSTHTDTSGYDDEIKTTKDKNIFTITEIQRSNTMLKCSQ